MKANSRLLKLVMGYLQQGNSLPSSQLRRLGLIYSSYRLIVSVFFIVMGYVTLKTDESIRLPSLLQLTGLAFYFLLSVVLFGLFYGLKKKPKQQLALGLALDVIVLSLLLYTNGAPDLQLTMLYMVVVAASFMLLQGSQALIITLLAIIFVIYQQFFYAIANSMSLTNLGDALLMSGSFLAVGFLSWSASQRLVHAENIAAMQAREVRRLNTINQEVISQMINGVMVIDEGRIVLANDAAYQLLDIPNQALTAADNPQTSEMAPTQRLKNRRKSLLLRRRHKQQLQQAFDPLAAFQRQLQAQHAALLESCLSIAVGQTRTFIYELPAVASASMLNKLRVQIIPLKDSSQLLLLEDQRREQANAQQLKLASLGQLTASIAHEIRNPLATISQASQLLMEEITENPVDGADESNHELYKMIFAQTKRVNRIIEDVLKLSRQQPPNQQNIPLATWMPEFLATYFGNQDVSLRLAAAPIIEFDTHQLEQILINVINNGLRYSGHEHAAVEIEVYSQQNDVIIDILDQGLGVNHAHLEQLFDPFFTTDITGTGLGLYLSQAFSEVNHARLLYVPEHEKTCFRLMIPIAGCPIAGQVNCRCFEPKS